MKTSQLFPRKQRQAKQSLLAVFTAEQAAANRELLMQQLEEAGLVEAANEYFASFQTAGGQQRNWLLPNVETVADLKDVYVDHVLKNFGYYSKQLRKIKELQEDELPWL